MRTSIPRPRVHLITAGHRHALDPEQGTSYSGRAGTVNQPPLINITGQLVAESPTQDFNAGSESNSFSVYRLFADEARQYLRVERRLFEFSDTSPRSGFRPSVSDTPFVDIPL